MDLKIKDVAELLNVSETTIRRWLAEGKIPAYRLHHQYRFSRVEIENWVMSCRLKKEQEALTTSEERQIFPEPGRGTKQFSLYRAIHKGGVYANIVGNSKEEYIRSSMNVIAKELSLDADVLSELLLDRENLMPTGLNYGVAVPHTRDFLLKGSEDFVAIVFPKEPLDWGSLDGKPVHTLFFLFASDDKRHLNLLAKLAHLSSNEKALAFLQTKPSKAALLDYIKNWETSSS